MLIIEKSSHQLIILRRPEVRLVVCLHFEQKKSQTGAIIGRGTFYGVFHPFMKNVIKMWLQ